MPVSTDIRKNLRFRAGFFMSEDLSGQNPMGNERAVFTALLVPELNRRASLFIERHCDQPGS